MIQDIFPKELHIEFHNNKPTDECNVLFFRNNKILLNIKDSVITYKKYNDIKQYDINCVYLFAIDNEEFFLALSDDDISDSEFLYYNINELRTVTPRRLAFGGFIAYHLYGWYRDNKFCGRCGSDLTHSDKERMLVCENCGNIVFPRIAPAVIVGITDGDKLLMTKYNGREYTNYALVAGFVEVGETVEDAVRREVMEEVGLKVKNITYYKSQPWGLSGSLLIGVFAELDGDAKITMDENELSEAYWIKREDIGIEFNGISLTNEMICKFKDNK